MHPHYNPLPRPWGSMGYSFSSFVNKQFSAGNKFLNKNVEQGSELLACTLCF